MSQSQRCSVVGPLVLAAGTVLAAVAGAAPATARAQDAASDENVVYDPALFQGLDYRSPGPTRGGRATAVAGVRESTRTFYMGSTGGGVWKTTDGGTTWSNVSDGYFDVGPVGAIAVSEADPNVVYAGTGSTCIRGNISAGRGVYKSVDAGGSWSFVGLPEAGQIGSILVHPKDPDRVYVAALGHAFGPNPERGVYRSTDGGATWEKVLFASDSTGAVDLAMDPTNPRVLYAALWRAERRPWTVTSGSRDGGLFKSVDGGDTWEKLGGGLPEGLVGKIGVTVSPADPDRVWALVEAPGGSGGVYRSDDAGSSWAQVNDERMLQQRAWYYIHIYADPQDPSTVYASNTGFYRSEDGGRTFERIRTPHGDSHALWVNPDHPEVMIEGDDGGAAVTTNGGETWSTQLNQPTAEFYRLTVDDRFPYRLYGSQQDNSNISVPSRITDGITPQQNWFAAGGCESGHIEVDPRDPDIVWAGCYSGFLDRVDRSTGMVRNVVPYPQMQDGHRSSDMKYRFQWNAPIVISPHDPDVVYYGSQHVHRTTDDGQSWDVISPDLSRADPSTMGYAGGPITRDQTGVEIYATVFSLVESPEAEGELWAGTDDGRVHITRDGGATWTEITPDAMPGFGTVNTIELSPHASGRAYMAVYRYRHDDFRPYVFRTDDFGESWELLTDGENGIPGDHFVRVVREDPVREGLLFAGTEYGVYVSFDAGERWQPLQLDLPATPVTDMKVHRGDLVLSTQGRSFWILDDISPLRQLDGDVASAGAWLFEPAPAHRVEQSGFRTSGDVPENAPDGAVFDYYFAEEPEGEVRLEIRGPSGDLIRSFSSDSAGHELPAEAGANRFVWDLSHPGADVVDDAVIFFGYDGGPTAVPGDGYEVRLVHGDWSAERSFEIRRDPRLPTTVADYREQFELLVRIRDKVTETHDLIRDVRDVRDQVRAVADRLADREFGDEIEDRAETLAERLTEVEGLLIQTKNESRQDPINFPSGLDNMFAHIALVVVGSEARPTDGAYQRLDDLAPELDAVERRFERIVGDDVAALNARLQELGVAPLILPVTADVRTATR